MKRLYTLLLCALAVLLVPALQARASLRDYGVQFSQGSRIDAQLIPLLTGPNENDNDRVSKPNDMGFTFYLDGKPYNSFSVSDNGLIGLGNAPVTGCWVNQLNTQSGLCDGGIIGYDYTLFSTPHIAAWWDDQVTNVGGAISYAIVGEEPNRVLVVSFDGMWTDYYKFGEPSSSNYQVRFYETSNKIEFYYDYMDPNFWGGEFGDGGSIGVATASDNFISINADFNYETFEPMYSYSSDRPNDYNYLQDPEFFGLPTLPSGTLITFNPCQIQFTGNLEQGGTERMAPGDSLLKDVEVMRFSSVDYTPFGMYLDGACASHGYTATISGPAAADYQISPSEGMVYPRGEKESEDMVPTITFTPHGVGLRYATLTITDDLNRTTQFALTGVGTPRVVYVPDLAQGGTENMKDRDSILYNARVRRGQTGDFTPFTLRNISEDQEAPPADVTFSLAGLSGGQYSIVPGSTSIGAGGSYTPTIHFAPTGVGLIIDTLYVNAEGEVRKFVLRAISVAVGAKITYNDQPIGPGTGLFRNSYDCLGDGALSIPLKVENIGIGAFQINGLVGYELDTSYKVGQPPYPVIHDEEGDLVPMNDYVITEQPFVRGTTPHYPITVEEGQTKTLYLTFVGSLPGKRFGRVFVNTNAENFTDPNVDGIPVEGLFAFEAYARGTSAILSDNPDGKLPRPVVFPPTGIDASSDMKIPVFNAGQCTLRLNMDKLQIYSGDVKEFSIVEVPAGTTIDQNTHDILIQPGGNVMITVRFTPSQIGSRRATLAMVTNDSTVDLPGHTIRGVYYLDLYGTGGTGLYTSNVDLGGGLIGGTTADQGHGMTHLVNNSSTAVTIVSTEIVGTDAVDFAKGAGWPALPIVVMPGQSIDLPVTFAPTGGTAGARSARLSLVTSSGDSLWSDLTGVAGTRTISVDKTSLTFAPTTTSKQSRQSVMITNNGTMPATLMIPIISGPGAADFSLSSLPRMTLQPGQSEMLEVTYIPTTSGQTSTATLTIGSNATGSAGSIAVTLNGKALKAGGTGVDDPSATAIGGIHDGQTVPDDHLSLSGVDGEVTTGGMTLRQSVPNPARDMVEISYTLAGRSDVTLSLYDGNGRLVRVLDRGAREMGERTVQVDVSGLASGVYHYRLTANGRVLDRSLRVVK
jgi:hypothetical protein